MTAFRRRRRAGRRRNPLRQVIVNTHSPSVVACVDDDALLVAHARRGGDSAASRLSIRHLPDTWRDKEGADEPAVTRGDLLAYLNPLLATDDGDAPRDTKAALAQLGVGATEAT